jgi:hypothetical protein
MKTLLVSLTVVVISLIISRLIIFKEASKYGFKFNSELKTFEKKGTTIGETIALEMAIKQKIIKANVILFIVAVLTTVLSDLI